ncbi:MAG TPA: HIT family protein [Chthonomonadaceae bacterium]|nr:HIT family protein [Chthonomonadaceae bacterium]
MSDDRRMNETFEMRRAGIGCPMCPDSAGEDVVVELPSGRVHLQDDADYRGYCILVFRRHTVEIHELTAEERAAWIEDISRIGSALAQQCGPSKLNVTMLGNMVPHLHCHIIPRYPTDPDWGHPPKYRRPADRRPLSPVEFAELKSALARALAP